MSIQWCTTGLPQPYEVAGTLQETSQGGVHTATVTLTCDWADRYVIQDDLEFAFNDYPYRPGQQMWCTAANIRPVGDGATADGYGLSYEKAFITVTYAQVPAGPIGGQGGDVAFYDEQIEPAGEFKTLDYRHFTWSDGTKIKAGDEPGVLVLCHTYVVHWQKLAYVPAELFEAVNHVNKYDVYSPSLDVTFDKETLLMAGSPVRRQITNMAGNNYWDLTIRWLIRPDGWNKYWNVQKTGGPGWDQLYLGFGATPFDPYPLYDMSGFLP